MLDATRWWYNHITTDCFRTLWTLLDIFKTPRKITQMKRPIFPTGHIVAINLLIEYCLTPQQIPCFYNPNCIFDFYLTDLWPRFLTLHLKYAVLPIDALTFAGTPFRSIEGGSTFCRVEEGTMKAEPATIAGYSSGLVNGVSSEASEKTM